MCMAHGQQCRIDCVEAWWSSAKQTHILHFVATQINMQKSVLFAKTDARLLSYLGAASFSFASEDFSKIF